METDIVYFGDCLDEQTGMSILPDKSIDMVLCDLPYGTTEMHWDTLLPMEKLWEQYERVVKDNGVICLFGSEPFSSVLRTSNMKNFKYDWVWVKNNVTGFAHAKNAPLKKHETISVFSYAPIAHANLVKNRMKYYPQGLTYSPKKKNGKKHYSAACKGRRPSDKDEYISEYTNYPVSVLFYDAVKNIGHPTVKPIPLLEYLIKTYTIEGDVVLDNCIGSGSTAVACLNTNRKFVAWELDEKNYNIAQKRLLHHKQDLELTIR